MKHVKKLLVWIPTILLLFVIYHFSSANGVQSSAVSNKLTNKLINAFIAVPFIDFNPVQEKISIQVLYVLVRKLGHLTEYAALALTMAFALYKYRVNSGRLIFWCMAFGFFYACTDEFHQLFILGRSGQFTDVLIDSLGMFFGILFFYFVIFFCHSLKFRISKNVTVK